MDKEIKKTNLWIKRLKKLAIEIEYNFNFWRWPTAHSTIQFLGMANVLRDTKEPTIG